MIDVRDFGAVGDGVADDTAALQAAIAACEATVAGLGDSATGGGTVFLPSGVYRTTDTLRIAESQVTLRGEGMRASEVRYEGTGTAIYAWNADRLLHRLAFAEFTCSGNPASGVGILLRGVHRVDFRAVEARQHGTWGMRFAMDSGDPEHKRETNDVKLFGCEIRENYEANAQLGQGGGILIDPQCEHVYLYGTHITTRFGNPRANSIGLSISERTNVVAMYGGTIYGHGRGASIYCDTTESGANTSSIVLRGTYYENNDVAIRASSKTGGHVKNLVIGDNSFSASGSCAVELHDVDGVTIDGNDVRNSSAPFLKIDGSVRDVRLGRNTPLGNFTGPMIDPPGMAPWHVQRRQNAKRVQTASIPAFGILDVPITWDTAFPDTAYTVSVAVLHGSIALRIRTGVKGLTATGCTIAVQNEDAVARAVTLHVSAIGDG